MSTVLGKVTLYSGLLFGQVKEPLNNIWDKFTSHKKNYQIAVYCDEKKETSTLGLDPKDPRDLDLSVTAFYDSETFSYSLRSEQFSSLQNACQKKFSTNQDYDLWGVSLESYLKIGIFLPISEKKTSDEKKAYSAESSLLSSKDILSKLPVEISFIRDLNEEFIKWKGEQDKPTLGQAIFPSEQLLVDQPRHKTKILFQDKTLYHSHEVLFKERKNYLLQPLKVLSERLLSLATHNTVKQDKEEIRERVLKAMETRTQGFEADSLLRIYSELESLESDFQNISIANEEGALHEYEIFSSRNSLKIELKTSFYYQIHKIENSKAVLICRYHCQREVVFDLNRDVFSKEVITLKKMQL